MENQYIMAKIELPLLLHPDGKYDVMNDRAKISFSRIDTLPEIQTKTQIHMSELFAQLGETSGKIRMEEVSKSPTKDGLVFRTNSEINSDKSENKESEIDIEQDNKPEEEDEEPPLVLKTEIKPRHRKPQTGGKTFKNRKYGGSQQYTRRVYPVMA